MPIEWKDKLDFVLVEPAEPGNIGSSARAIKNMGFGNLVLVNPPELTPEAGWMARNATDVLDSSRRFGTLKEALAGSSLVVGTSRRKGKKRGLVLPLKEGVGRLVEATASGRVSVLFGREAKGLFNEEMEECAFMLQIPTGADQPSLNLSHAVLLIAYELSQHHAPETKRSDGRRATHDQLVRLHKEIGDLIIMLGYTKWGDRDVGERIHASLKQLANRAELSEREIKILYGMCSRVKDKLGG